MVNLERGRNSNSRKDNYMITVTKDDLLKSGAHFGHITSKTNPNFRDYVLSQKNGIDIINLDDTINNLSKALLFVKNKTYKLSKSPILSGIQPDNWLLLKPN